MNPLKNTLWNVPDLTELLVKLFKMNIIKIYKDSNLYVNDPPFKFGSMLI